MRLLATHPTAAFGYDHVSTTSKSFLQSSDVRPTNIRQMGARKARIRLSLFDVGRPTIQTDGFIDPIRFQTIVRARCSCNGEPIAGVVNHHVLASDLLKNCCPRLRRAIGSPTNNHNLSDHFKSGDATISIAPQAKIHITRKNIAADEDVVERLRGLALQ